MTDLEKLYHKANEFTKIKSKTDLDADGADTLDTQKTFDLCYAHISQDNCQVRKP